MTATDLFRGGTPEGRGEALAAARAALASGEAVAWHVDLGNVGLLSRMMLERKGDQALEVVLRAEDRAPDRTEVADEGELVPTLRRLRDKAPFRLRMSNGRPYVLPPPALDVSTNDLCGLACVMCKNRAPRRDPHTMAPDEVRALLAEAAAWGIRRVALTGAGEPFRDPEMLDHVRYANELGHLCTITTNGFPISEKVAAELAGRVASISVSIHGATEATQDAIVGVPTAGEHAFRAVRRLVAARDALDGKSKLSVNVSAVIQRDNVAEIAALVRRAHDEGCDGVNVQPINLQHGFIEAGRIVRRDDVGMMGSLWPTPAQAGDLDRLFDELAELRERWGKFLHASPERLALARRYFRSPSREALGVSCRVGETFLAVDHRGQVKPCYRLPWSHGDARLVSVRALWNSEAYAETRALIDRCPLVCMNNCFDRGGKG
jgi:MoaA/NifB/PqqE/SkfB family radical SAM enzyme